LLELLLEFMPLFHKHVMPSFHVDIRSSIGLSRSQAKALMILRDKGPSTATELGACLALTKASLTGLVDELEGMGLLRREQDPKDRRKAMLMISEQGQAKASEAMDELRRALAEKTGKLSAPERESLEAGFSNLIAILRTL
jgi:MarR family transcriptional regulator, organic hydroperoxide resistance regulator